jgi:hypothetical protein
MNKFNDNLIKQLMSGEQAIEGSDNAIDPALSWKQYEDQADAPLFVQPSELQSAEIANVNTSPIDKSNYMDAAQQEADSQSLPMSEAEQDFNYGKGVIESGQETPESFAAKFGDKAYQPATQDIAAPEQAPIAPSLTPQEKMMAEYKAMQEQDRKDLQDARSSDRNLKMGGAIGDALATYLNARGQMNVKAPGVQVQQGAGLGKIADMFATAPDVAADLKNKREDLLAQYKQLQTGKGAELAERKITAYEKQVNNAANKASTKPSEGEKTMDREFAKDYTDWKTAGKADFESNSKILEDAMNDLKSGKVQTGVAEGILAKNPIYVTSAAALESRVRKALNSGLRATFGAQFAEREGERIFQQTFDSRKSPEENAATMKIELDKIKDKAADMQDQANYFEKNKGSLSGYEFGKSQVSTESTLSEKDQKAYDWAIKNPDSAEAAEILKELGK